MLSTAFNNTFIEEVVIDRDVTWKYDKVKATVFGYCPKLKKIVANKLRFMMIEFAYFCPNLETVEMNGVNKIESKAFSYCPKLKTIQMRNIEHIFEYAFSHCTSLTLDFTKLPNLRTIGERAFEYCTSLSTLVIYSEAKLNEEYIFANSSLKRATIHGNIRFARHLFESCFQLESVTLDENCESIPDHCFQNCPKLTNLKLNPGIEIQTHAFYSSANVQLFDATQYSVDPGALRGILAQQLKISSTIWLSECPNLKKVIFSKDVSSLEGMAIEIDVAIEFEKGNPYFTTQNNILKDRDGNIACILPAYSGTSFEIPASMKVLKNAFAYNKNIKTITLTNPEEVVLTYAKYVQKVVVNSNKDNMVICGENLGGCINLEVLEINGPIVTIPAMNLGKLKNIICRKGSTIEQSFSFSSVESFDMTGLNMVDSAFNGCKKLKSIKLGDLTHINPYMFYECESLTDIDLSKVEQIREYAFENCRSLESIDLSSIRGVFPMLSIIALNLKILNGLNQSSIYQVMHSQT